MFNNEIFFLQILTVRFCIFPLYTAFRDYFKSLKKGPAGQLYVF